MVTHIADPIRIGNRIWLALLLLALAAVQWVTVLPFIAVVAAVLLPWLVRLNIGSRQYAVFASVYAAAVVFILPPFDLGAALFARLAPFFAVLVLAYLLGLALDGVQDGSVWAWFAPLVLLVAMPSVYGLLSVLGLAALAAMQKQHTFAGANPFHLERNHIWNLTLIFAAVAAFAFILPMPRSLQDPTGGSSINQASPAKQKELEKPRVNTQGEKILPRATNKIDSTQDAFFASVSAMLYALVMILGFYILGSRVQKSKGAKKIELWDFMPIIAALILATVLFALALSAPNGGSNPAMNSDTTLNQMNGEGTTRQLTLAELEEQIRRSRFAQNLWIPYVLAAILLLMLYWAFRKASKTHIIKPESESDTPPSSQPSQAASNRVRAAYQNFLEFAKTQGVPRGEAETPLEFAQRFADINPISRVFALQITNLYEPVRYGKLVAETNALEAEKAVQQIMKGNN